MQRVREDMTGAKLGDICDSLYEKALMEKLKNLFDLEANTIMNSRLLHIGSECYTEDSRSARSAQQEKTSAVEHRIELLNQSEDENEIERSFAHAEAVAQYGEKRVMSQIDANAQAMVQVVPALSAQIFARRKYVYESFASAKMVEKLAGTDFEILRQYYNNSQKSLHAKFALQEKTYLEHELQGMQRQLDALTDILDRSHAESQTRDSTSEESHRRCDELYQWFCDRALVLQYSNSTATQDCEWWLDDARHAVNKWRHATSAELENALQIDICQREDEYIQRVESLSRELEELRQRELEARLKRLQLRNLASTPPFALKMAAQAREKQDIRRLEGAVKQVSDSHARVDESSLSSAYRVHSGSHIVELANASHLAEEHLAEDLCALLASVSAWKTQGTQEAVPATSGSSARIAHADEAALVRSVTALLPTARKAKKLRDAASIPSPLQTTKKHVYK